MDREPTTPKPVYHPAGSVTDTTALDAHEKMRLRAAAYRVTRMYPGPVGQLAARELEAASDMGCRFVNGSLIAELVDHIMRPHDS